MDEWQNELVSSDEAIKEFKTRSLEYTKFKVPVSEKEKYSTPEFTFLSESKKGCWFKKEKPKDEKLEDKVWCMFFKMGFTKLNQGRKFTIHWSENRGDSKQIDVFCADEETALIIECKNGYAKSSLKENIESFKGILPDIKLSILRAFPNLKIAFIYVTEGYTFSEEDDNRLKAIGRDTVPCYHFDEKTLDNYCQLVEQLGSAAKYQLLGLLFKGRTIKNFDNKVCAIEGKMGGLTYYSFSMKPSQLLKMAYVLHRNNVNSTDEMMPSYQRIIKKDRLAKIRNFIENEKGYFPNAIIVSIRTKDENKKTLDFEPAPKQDSSSLSRIGIVKLPQEYQTAYVIDGQHRLYGYSSTSYADKNSIPVIAFVNMDKSEQVKMFMEINQNQKAVPKVLRDTLEADLLYDSKNYQSVNNAIKKRIAMKLGENRNSPLFGMILTGENSKKEDIPLTIEGLAKALSKTCFFNQYNKQNVVIKNGLFDFGIDKSDDSKKEKTEKTIYCLLTWLINTLKKNGGDKWNSESGFAITNNLIGAVICLLNDFVLLKISTKELNDCHPSLDETEKAINSLVTDLSLVLDDFTPSTNDELRKNKGEGGLIDTWHFIGAKINKIDSSFDPEWMQDYLDKYCQDNLNEAKDVLDALLSETKRIIRDSLKSIYQGQWELQIPDTIYPDLQKKLRQESRSNIEISNKDSLDFADFGQLHKIITFGDNYKKFGKKFFGNFKLPLFADYGDSKRDFLETLGKLYSRILDGKNLSKLDFDDLKKYKEEFSSRTKEETLQQ